MKRVWTLSALLCSSLGLPVIAQGQEFGSAMVQCPGPPPPFAFGREMTDAQVDEQIADRKEFLQNDAPKHLQIQQYHLEIDDLLSKENIDKAKILDLNAKISALRTQMDASAIERRLREAESMTPEQRRKSRRRLAFPPPPPPPHFMMGGMPGMPGMPGIRGMHTPGPGGHNPKGAPPPPPPPNNPPENE